MTGAVEDWQAGGFGLYVHWPFCQAKCPYCDFNSHVAGAVDQTRWLAAYRAEIARIAAETPGRVLGSIFFGGGTPSLMDPETVAGVIEAAREAWTPANGQEITLEANPSSVEAGRFRAYRDAGVNRVSVGVQALDDEALRALGRLHDAAEARRAVALAAEIFPRASADLIYARQHQSPGEWRRELGEALGMGLSHLSLYQLTIEDGTVFGRRHAAGALAGLPDEDRAVALWEITQDMTTAAGLAAYEVSNHAEAGAEGRHNLVYWRGGDYAGIGPGAHGRLTLGGRRWTTEALRAPGAWLAAVERDGRGETGRTTLGPEEIALERLLMGLRLAEGVDLERLGRLIDVNALNLEDYVETGQLEAEGRFVRATPAGRIVLNAVLRGLAERL